MRRLISLKLILLVILSVTICFIYYKFLKLEVIPKLDSYQTIYPEHQTIISNYVLPDQIYISFVVCGARFNESVNVVKSVLLFTKRKVHFVIFTDEKLRPQFHKILREWQKIRQNQLFYELHRIQFPKGDEKEWLTLFKKCAAQRLFIPDLLPDIDSLIYLDTDTLVLEPVEDLWRFFRDFNSTQMTAMALEHEDPNISWYPRFAQHPFYGKLGLNSGVMLMNLTRLRAFGWQQYLAPVLRQWRDYISWGDQDIINIVLSYHGEAVLVLPCSHNVRTDHCLYGAACNSVLLLHGSRGAFHNHQLPAFSAVYGAFAAHLLGSSPLALVTELRRRLDELPQTPCTKLLHAQEPRCTQALLAAAQTSVYRNNTK